MNDTPEVKKSKPSAKDSLPNNKKEAQKKTAHTKKPNVLMNKEDKITTSPPKPATNHTPQAAQQPAPKKGGGTVISVIALLVAVGTLTVGYQALQQSNNEQQAMQKRLSDAESSLSNSDTMAQEARNAAAGVKDAIQASQSNSQNLTTLASSLEEKLAQVDGQLGNISGNSSKLAELASSQQALQNKLAEFNEALAKIQNTPDISKTDWLLAEARHLIVSANQQATLAKNAKVAAIALETANQRLGEVGDSSLTSIRQIISDKSAALRNVPSVDITAIALVLSNLEAQTDGLPLASVASQQYTPDESVNADESVSGLSNFADKVWADVKSLVTVRRSNDEISPALLPPGQRFFLQQNLRLKLEAARLALLKSDTQTFRTSIKTASQWITKYFDADATATKNMLSALAPYANIELNPSIPDAQDALDAFDQWQTQHTTAQLKTNTAEGSQS